MTVKELAMHGYKQLACRGDKAVDILLDKVNELWKNKEATTFTTATDLQIFEQDKTYSVSFNISDGEIILFYN